jgi:hypothetical protein
MPIYNNNFAPFLAKANAVALPIPEDPPVIIATLFLNAVSIILFFYSRTVFFFGCQNIFNSFDKGIGIK